MEKFSTLDVAPRQRLHFWNELVAEIYPGTFVNSPNEALAAEMWRWRIRELAMIRPCSEASVVGRTPVGELDAERVLLHLQHKGSSRHTQKGRQAELCFGDFSLCSVAEPYLIDLSPGHELLIIEFPRQALADRMPDLEDRMARRISGCAPGARIFHDFLLSLWQQGDLSHADPVWQQGVSNVFFDLLGLAMRGSDGAGHVAGGRLGRRLLVLVDAQLSDPDLRTASLAGELNISIRSVQNLFAAMGTTPTAYVMERRLKRSAELLVAEPDRSVTDIAFDVGFNDRSYFARCFRQLFQMTPSAWRRRHGSNARPSTRASR